MKIFLSVSYSSQIAADGAVHPEYRANLEAVMAPLEKAGHTVFCAPRADKWKINDLKPDEAFELDKKTVAETDVVVAFFGDSVSAGIHFELGLAYSQNKTIILAREKNVKLPYVDTGLLAQPNVHELVYNDIRACGDLILQRI
jgi:nucleoside 2-deoxyribosyltransferase